MPPLDDPITLRPLRELGPTPGSVFDDPGDDKSWYASQRSDSLERFYDGRDPSWYESALAPLRGARRVLDIGCGPGLALARVREHGAETTLGVDRWPSFVRRADANGVSMVLHDLTLPMPFIGSGSFDGIISHYVLNYMSPIGVRQVLRECARILAGDGLLVLYLGAIGLGSGDESQTIPYDGATMETLLAEAGFAEIHVEMSPNGRNTVARAGIAGDGGARTRAQESFAAVTGTGVRAEVGGETQLIAAFAEATGGPVGVSVFDADRSAGVQLSGGDGGERVAVCVRVVGSNGAGSDLQLWAWEGTELIAAEAIQLGFSPTSIQLDCEGRVEYLDSWSPSPLGLEQRSSAYVSAGEVRPADGLSEAERGAEGRLVVVEGDPLDHDATRRVLGAGRNRFLIRRPRSGADLATLDSEFASGRASGIVLDAEAIAAGDGPTLCLWAASRQALLLIEGDSWDAIASAVEVGHRYLGRAPVLLIDPALRGGSASPPPEPLLSLTAAWESRLLVLPSGAARPSGLRGRILLGGAPAADDGDATEALRYLTERTLLMSMRLRAEHPQEQLGRGPGF